MTNLQPLTNGSCIEVPPIQQAIMNHLTKTIAKERSSATNRDWFHALAYALRDRLTERWMKTMNQYYQQDTKRVYYLSLEFLTGRLLTQSMLNLGVHEECQAALKALGLDDRCLYELESEPGLGNGGLGRLAACFMDSLATLNLPGYGYGIRYEYGMFYQRFSSDGHQVEHPDNWLRYGNPWEFPRPEVLYKVNFGGEDVMAMAYDIPVPGYGTATVNNLRLWAAKSSRDFNLQYFNEGNDIGNYIKAVEDKNNSENLSKVLYPDDTTAMGRELRFRQEYFFVSASIQDIIRRYLLNRQKSDINKLPEKVAPQVSTSIQDIIQRYLANHQKSDINKLPEKVAIQLNDTHPAMAIPEMMRILLDYVGLSWKEAWEMSMQIFAYTNHTLLPEALETWPVSLFERLLPRHLQIIYEINQRFLKEVRHRHPGDMEALRRLSLIGEDGDKHVRMSHLAVVGSHKVNGVAALHTQLMKATIFADFERLYPDRIVNKTNGVTPRRWLNEANPELCQLIKQHIGNDWVTDLWQLQKLMPLAENPDFRANFRAVKQQNKRHLATFIGEKLSIHVNPESLFDVHIKRIHEYKRQLLNLLHVITRYNWIRANPNLDIVPRTMVFAGKAAPGYVVAKLIIRLINNVAEVINHDPVIGDRLKVVFIPNYDVSTALRIIPAADLSEQISTAGTEASGTGNMKLALNGALTIGTLDGANIEIREEVGEDNIFIFGLTAEGVADLRRRWYNPRDYYHANQELKQVLDMISSGYFSPEQSSRFQPIIDNLLHHGRDHYMLLADYADYIACQNRIDELYRQPEEWTRKAILNVAKMGKFSSDRTISEYAEEIWQVKAVKPNLSD